MMIDRATYPQPRLDNDNAEFLRAWKERGKLLIRACKSCGTQFYYPRPMCPSCWSDDLEWVETTGKGSLVSYAIVYVPNDPAFLPEVPAVFGEVRLDNGTLLLSRIIVDNVDSVTEDLPLELISGPEAREFPLPTFTISKSRQASG
ncbi:MAG: Zn-ribbon domain-containing OB-fold protein [Reyranellaceae bacterium]